MIKQKNALTQVNTSSSVQQEDLFVDYLKSISLIEAAAQALRKENAKRKLEAAKNVSQLIKKNTLAAEEEHNKLATTDETRRALRKRCEVEEPACVDGRSRKRITP